MDAQVISLSEERKKVTTNMVSFQFDMRPETAAVPSMAIMVLITMLRVQDPLIDELVGKGLILVFTTSGGIMWMHPDLIDDYYWNSIKKKPITKRSRKRSSNMISLIPEFGPNSIAIVEDSRDFQIIYQVATTPEISTSIRSGHPYLHQYNGVVLATST